MYDGEHSRKRAVVSPKISQCSDERLVELYQQQSPAATDALQTLIKRYQQRVYRACLKYLHREDDADDACQEVFVRVFLYLEKFEGRSSFKNWLHRIVQNQCYSMAARQDRLVYGLEAEDEIDIKMKTVLDGIFLKEDIEKTLVQLSDGDRHVLQLRYLQESSMEEIATALRIQLSAAKMRLLRAKQRFKAAYSTLEE